MPYASFRCMCINRSYKRLFISHYINLFFCKLTVFITACQHSISFLTGTFNFGCHPLFSYPKLFIKHWHQDVQYHQFSAADKNTHNYKDLRQRWLDPMFKLSSFI